MSCHSLIITAGPAQIEAGFGQEGQTRRSNLQILLLLLFTLLNCSFTWKTIAKRSVCMSNYQGVRERERPLVNKLTAELKFKQHHFTILRASVQEYKAFSCFSITLCLPLICCLSLVFCLCSSCKYGWTVSASKPHQYMQSIKTVCAVCSSQ